jgi:hypothetical protein
MFNFFNPFGGFASFQGPPALVASLTDKLLIAGHLFQDLTSAAPPQIPDANFGMHIKRGVLSYDIA